MRSIDANHRPKEKQKEKKNETNIKIRSETQQGSHDVFFFPYFSISSFSFTISKITCARARVQQFFFEEILVVHYEAVIVGASHHSLTQSQQNYTYFQHLPTILLHPPLLSSQRVLEVQLALPQQPGLPYQPPRISTSSSASSASVLLPRVVQRGGRRRRGKAGQTTRNTTTTFWFGLVGFVSFVSVFVLRFVRENEARNFLSNDGEEGYSEYEQHVKVQMQRIHVVHATTRTSARPTCTLGVAEVVKRVLGVVSCCLSYQKL